MELSFQVLQRLELLTKLRRDLHKIPEISNQEYKTQQYICSFLEDLGVRYTKIKTGVVAEFKAEKKTEHTLALRADTDALAIVEKNDIAFKSQHTGVMHACGHDGHVAMLLTVCDILAKSPPKVNVKAIFQFGEEGAGGAQHMIEGDCLKDVNQIYALHLDPTLAEGAFATREGAMMAGALELAVHFSGRNAHCAQPDKGIDALKPLGVLLFTHTIGEFSHPDTLFHIGTVHGGSTHNSIADSAFARATLRYFKESDRDVVLEKLGAILADADKNFGATCRVEETAHYPPLVNTNNAVAKVTKILPDILTASPSFTAEDFAFYTQKVDGALVWLGTMSQAYNSPLHSNTFNFDEKVLLNGVEFFLRLTQES